MCGSGLAKSLHGGLHLTECELGGYMLSQAFNSNCLIQVDTAAPGFTKPGLVFNLVRELCLIFNLDSLIFKLFLLNSD